MESTSQISLILLAALPVGAATIMVLKGYLDLYISTRALIKVVLPVPGPPTINEKELLKKLLIAFF